MSWKPEYTFEKGMIELFEGKVNCCGCSACMSICPKQAIKMEVDLNGFVFPKINHDLCIECGLCKKVCPFQTPQIFDRETIATYVAINNNSDVLLNSAAGGIFGALTSYIFENNRVVFGRAYNNAMEPEHICIDNSSDMIKLQGSKYVQSNINNTYIETKNYLKMGRWVLFTGTPCQISGLKSYLGTDYYNLITADIICHGVPSAKFFRGYIKHLEEKLKGKVIDFKFWDKAKEWGLIGKVFYEKNGKVNMKMIASLSSYYYSYFLRGDIIESVVMSANMRVIAEKVIL